MDPNATEDDMTELLVMQDVVKDCKKLKITESWQEKYKFLEWQSTLKRRTEFSIKFCVRMKQT